ncbi:endonuclease/exonuclease/phosphatase family protein [Winogradskyella sp. UBA3174]|uniref:endonuclease/exonuclease/phosphatase family protein n=1 Tax=Winogradskyella sp. UBA3174 TaxID=1947785 RepID=UPI0025E88C91|nr:endonuclease/exonuclease/phosphatase family protein [Winogradskyella sp. UBA3174]|tara:strand:- start:7070 stop:8131 length:1062 start_codon:yes stop_codon:yes gene_type:complete
MKILKSCLVLLALVCISNVWSQQEKRFKIHTVAFYNLENLFDTINDPLKYDEASPMMEIKANRSEIYKKKVKNMARVVANIGSDRANNSPAIIGVCEIENRKVLEDLVNDPLLLAKDYGIIHFEGPDRRSIDVALLYQKALFKPTDSSSHELLIYDNLTRKRVYTRDQLLVSGKLDGDLIHILVNHWPSRSGGEARSRSKRVGAAKLNKSIIDSIQSVDPYAKIFTMGDLNDDPTNESVKKILKAEKDKTKVPLKGIYNPFEKMFTEKGYGTTAYRDAWSLFDQIMMTKPLLDDDYSSFRFWKAGIYNKAYLTNKRGRYEGYPFRSFADGGFTDGFSDHFPVYVYLIKEVKED